MRRRELSRKSVSILLAVLAELFMLCGVVTLYLTPYPVSLTIWHLAAILGGWNLAWLGSAWLLHRRLANFDTLILLLAALLTGWGLIMQTRLAPAMIYRQVLWLLIGCSVMCAVALAPGITRTLRRYRYTLLTSGILLLGATLIFGVNPSGYGQKLWLGAFGLYMQPSEPLKLLLVIYLAAYLAEKRDLPAMRAAGQSIWWIILGPMLVMVGLALLLLGWQQDLGAALLFYFTFVTMISLAWGKWRYSLLSVALFVPVGVAGYTLSSRVALRVSIWLDTWAPEQADRAFQILQSLFAFSAGGLMGQGLGQGSPGLIPAVHTDFVFAALVEEFGLAGGLALLLLIAALVYRGIRLAQKSTSEFESLLAGGIVALIAIQTWVITGGNAKLIPITGVTLPFLSYGGSSLVTMLAATGLLINLSTPHPLPLVLSLAPAQGQPLRQTAAGLGQILLLLLGSVAVTTGVWAVARAGGLRVYPTNPRYVLSEARIQRGRILDRNQVVLADITIDEDGYVVRTYPVPEAAAAVGYATLEYGTVGIEAACDARLRGDVDRTAWDNLTDGLLHIAPMGRDVRLTLDAELQTAAQQALRGRIGAAVLVDARTGEILALASSPIYDSAAVVEQWSTLRDAADSPFLNRATQALAQPGTSLQPLILASALQVGLAQTPAEPITQSISFNGLSVTCRRIPQTSTWQEMLSAGCPGPFVDAAVQLGAAEFTESLELWGLLGAPSLALPTVASDVTLPFPDAVAEALGQGELLVTPLQMVQAIAALGNEGLRPTLRILAQSTDGCTEPPPDTEVRVVSAEIAETVRQSLTRYNGAVGHRGISVAGEERQQSWFVGLNSEVLPRYAVAVIIDRPTAPQAATNIGTELLGLVVNP
jgi:cell division protein FtsW (lipid II flippase)